LDPLPTAPPPAPPILRPRARAWLVLTRGSNLPTVWSNCLAGWWLGGAGGGGGRLLALTIGASALYTAGMFFNDYYDAGFDAKFRPERPIPAGLVRRQTVGRAGLAAVGAGAACLCPLGLTTAALTAALVCLILAYDRFHKRLAHGPLLMAGCRFLLYLLAASTAPRGVGLTALAGAAGLAAYVAGLSYLARGEGLPGRLPGWPWGLMAVPLPLALLPRQAVPWDPWRASLYAAPFALWLWRAWRKGCRPGARPPVADLLAGMALADLALAAPMPPVLPIAFISLFLLARWFQRRIPAT
jgi:4-hydroxybenzoate polyprenyltransferase